MDKQIKGVLGEKLGMTQVWDADNRVVPVTVVKAGPCVVTQVRSIEKDGYAAVQVGTGTRKAARVGKAVLGHTGGKGYEAIREFRSEDAMEKGAEIKVDTFAVGDEVQVSGLSKGKGFAGVVKRHGFHGGPRTHGQKHSEREPGSIGGSGGRAGGRVAKGMRMAGRLGHDRVTVKNLRVLAIDAATNEIIVSGAVPGARGTLLEVVSA